MKNKDEIKSVHVKNKFDYYYNSEEIVNKIDAIENEILIKKDEISMELENSQHLELKINEYLQSIVFLKYYFN